jgi:predicted RNase H-like HicB family nuclease
LADYIALIHKDADSDYGVSFPDFPGCITAGSTLDEARAMAVEALLFHIEGMREDGRIIPTPSPLADVMTARPHRDAEAFLVAVPDQPGRA